MQKKSLRSYEFQLLFPYLWLNANVLEASNINMPTK